MAARSPRTTSTSSLPRQGGRSTGLTQWIRLGAYTATTPHGGGGAPAPTSTTSFPRTPRTASRSTGCVPSRPDGRESASRTTRSPSSTTTTTREASRTPTSSSATQTSRRVAGSRTRTRRHSQGPYRGQLRASTCRRWRRFRAQASLPGRSAGIRSPPPERVARNMSDAPKRSSPTAGSTRGLPTYGPG